MMNQFITHGHISEHGKLCGPNAHKNNNPGYSNETIKLSCYRPKTKMLQLQKINLSC